MKNKRVGVVRAYNLHDELTQLGLTVEPVNSNLNGIRMLHHNRIDVYYGFRNPVIYTVLSELNLPEPIFHELRRSPYYVCLSRKLKDVDLVIQRLNQGLQEIRSSGEFQKILSRYP